MINCPNPSCKTANPEEADTCQVCQSVLPHYYLWGVGDLVANLKPGTLVNQRYLLKHDCVFLDTKPGLSPESLPEVPRFLMPYLHLSAYPLHIPRPYCALKTPENDYVLMLESSALSVAQPNEDSSAQPFTVPTQLPRLINRWKDAPPLRQLNWLWQIAQMWDAFVEEQVAATLVDSSLLRVDGSIVRLLELASPMPTSDGNGRAGVAQSTAQSSEKISQPTLVDLARSWQPLAESAHQAVRSFLRRLCENLEHQRLNSEQLSEQLSQAISVCGSNQRVAYDLSVQTDQGPTRKRNEDACFPESGTRLQPSSEQTQDAPQLLIVCDGIGGHQGGDVASKLAIATIRQQLEPILSVQTSTLTSSELSLAIESAICAANDEISAQNDQAQRQARDRMGTTLVLALIRGADVYIAHLGDSRAYRVSRRNCQQVTLDDDVASRQVRLGGALYREVLMQPGSGSLIQALGMGPSQSLRPTVQRFVIDENCVFLLCSDGLSDSDRVEQYWQRELAPLVWGKAPFVNAGSRLVNLANEYNGHDNVTVGLINAQVTQVSDRIVPRELATASQPTTAIGESGSDDVLESGTATTQIKAPSKKSSSSKPRKGRPITTLGAAKGDSPVKPSPEQSNTPSFAKAESASTAVVSSDADSARHAQKNSQKSGRYFRNAGLALLLAVLAGGLSLLAFPGLRQRFFPLNGDQTGQDEAADSQTEVVQSEGASSTDNEGLFILPPLNVNDFVRVSQAVTSEIPSGEPGDDFRVPLLYPSPSAIEEENTIPGTVPTGAILQVVSKQTAEDDSSWVQVKLCTIPSGDRLSDVPSETDTAAGRADTNTGPSDFNVPESTNTAQPLMLDPGSEGWMVETRLAAIARPIENLQPDQQGSCGN